MMIAVAWAFAILAGLGLGGWIGFELGRFWAEERWWKEQAKWEKDAYPELVLKDHPEQGTITGLPGDYYAELWASLTLDTQHRIMERWMEGKNLEAEDFVFGRDTWLPPDLDLSDQREPW